MKSKFFTFGQNNSGGSFDFDSKAGITHYVIIEAPDLDDATRRAELIGLYWNGCDTGQDCSCCGDRWDGAYPSEGDEKPSIYGEVVEGSRPDNMMKWMDGPEVFVHLMDGSVQGYYEDDK